MDDLVSRSQRALARVRKASNELDKTLRSSGLRPVRRPVKRRAKPRDELDFVHCSVSSHSRLGKIS